MKSVLSIKTANGSMIRLGAADDVSNSILETTARIHETDFPCPESLSGSAFPDVILHSGAPLPDGVSAEPLLQAGGVEIFRAGNRFRFRISGQVPEGWEESLRYRLPLLHAVMLATLSGSECCLFHGCLLLNSNGEGVILTGEAPSHVEPLSAGGRSRKGDALSRDQNGEDPPHSLADTFRDGAGGTDRRVHSEMARPAACRLQSAHAVSAAGPDHGGTPAYRSGKLENRG